MNNPHELRATRQDHMVACEKLIKQARADNKDLAGNPVDLHSINLHHIASHQFSTPINATASRNLTQPKKFFPLLTFDL